MTNNSAYSFFLGWLVIIVAFWAGLKLEGTKTIIYYVLWLTVVLTVVVHYQELTEIIRGAGLPEINTAAEQRGRQPNG